MSRIDGAWARWDQTVLLHQAPNNLLGDGHGLLGERGVHPAVAVATVVALEDVGHGAAQLDVRVRSLEPCPMLEVGAACQAGFSEQVRQRVGRSQGINQLRLLPIRQEPLVDAQVFVRSSFAFFSRSCSSCRRRTLRRSASSCGSNSSRCWLGEESCWRFMDADASWPSR